MAEQFEEQLNEGTSTVTETSSENEKPPVVLKLQKPKKKKKVQWNAGTVDNEFMGKKSSKCCCVYEKPRVFGESSSESNSDNDDDDIEGHNAYCPGHKKEHGNPEKSDES